LALELIRPKTITLVGWLSLVIELHMIRVLQGLFLPQMISVQIYIGDVINVKTFLSENRIMVFSSMENFVKQKQLLQKQSLLIHLFQKDFLFGGKLDQFH
jgi:hypothetical protein